MRVGERAEQIFRGGRAGSAGHSTPSHSVNWIPPPLTLDLHRPQSAPPGIFPVSLSGCSGQELGVITDLMFVSCFTFHLSGNPAVSAFGLYPESTAQL